MKIRIIGVVLILCFFLSSCQKVSHSKNYAVLLGMERERLLQCQNYDFLVVDADFLEKEDIQRLQKNANKKIASYLSIGSLESFRKEFSMYKNLALSEYENWQEEFWVDVSDRNWQEHIKNKAEELKHKGVSVLFLDNTDIYYHYPEESVYLALLNILKELKALGFQLYINGGDAFLTKAIESRELEDLVVGVNQETVFSEINFEKKSFGRKKEEDRRYFQDYLQKCKDYGLEVYLLEYGTDMDLENDVKAYCQVNGFCYFISQSIELNQE